MGAVHNMWTSTEVARLRELAGTMVAPKIAAALGRTTASVTNQCQRLGIKLKARGQAHQTARHSDFSVAECWRLRRQGFGPSLISDRTGIPVSTVKAIIHCRRRSYQKPESAAIVTAPGYRRIHSTVRTL